MEVTLSPNTGHPMQVTVACPQGMSQGEVASALIRGYAQAGVVVQVEYGQGAATNGIPLGTIVITKKAAG